MQHPFDNSPQPTYNLQWEYNMMCVAVSQYLVQATYNMIWNYDTTCVGRSPKPVLQQYVTVYTLTWQNLKFYR